MIRSILIGWTILACLFLYAVGLYLLLGASGMLPVGVVSILMAAGLSYVAYDTVRRSPGHLPQGAAVRWKRTATRKPARRPAPHRPGVQVTAG